jgi:hypothetical protein
METQENSVEALKINPITNDASPTQGGGHDKSQRWLDDRLYPYTLADICSTFVPQGGTGGDIAFPDHDVGGSSSAPSAHSPAPDKTTSSQEHYVHCTATLVDALGNTGDCRALCSKAFKKKQTREEVSLTWQLPYPLVVDRVDFVWFEIMHLDQLVVAEFEGTAKENSRLRFKQIEESLAYRYCQGDALAFIEYQKIYENVTNCVQKYNKLIESIKRQGYSPPREGDFVCIYDGDSKPVVRDGRRRAAALKYVLGNIEIPVVRFSGDVPKWI